MLRYFPTSPLKEKSLIRFSISTRAELPGHKICCIRPEGRQNVLYLVRATRTKHFCIWPEQTGHKMFVFDPVNPDTKFLYSARATRGHKCVVLGPSNPDTKFLYLDRATRTQNVFYSARATPDTKFLYLDRATRIQNVLYLARKRDNYMN